MLLIFFCSFGFSIFIIFRGALTTRGLPRSGESVPFVGVTELARRRDHQPGEYSRKVEKAREEFRVGNLFECVLSQVFYEPCSAPPSEIFERLRERNPSPYMFVINLGSNEHLVGASPEMFVRCERTSTGIRVETCPISGTIKRGGEFRFVCIFFSWRRKTISLFSPSSFFIFSFSFETSPDHFFIVGIFIFNIIFFSFRLSRQRIGGC